MLHSTTKGPANINLSHSDENNQRSLEEIRAEVEAEVIDIFNSGENVLLESLPETEKTRSVFHAVKETGQPVTYLTKLNENRGQAKNLCDKFGLEWEALPVLSRSCPSVRDTNNSDIDATIEECHSNGLAGRSLHQVLVDSYDLPCGEECPYLQELEKSYEDVDVLVGGTTHALKDKYIEDRFVVFDGFSPEAFESHIEYPAHTINQFIDSIKSDLRFESYEGIFGIRETWDASKRSSWDVKHGGYADLTNAKTIRGYHTQTPFLAFSVLYAEEMPNGNWERFAISDLPEDHSGWDSVNSGCVCLRDTEKDELYLLNPPELEKASGVLALDSTTTPEMWDVYTGIDLEYRQMMDEQEKQQFITDTLNLEIIELDDKKRPYHNRRNITPPKDTKTAYGIWLAEGEKPGLLSSKLAIDGSDDKDGVYQEENGGEIFKYVDEYTTMAQSQAYDVFDDSRVGFLPGMPNYGHDFVARWAAYQGLTLGTNGEEYPEKKFCLHGNGAHEHFEIPPFYRQLTLQHVLSFAQDDEPCTVYVDTIGLPEWVPTTTGDIPRFNRTKRRIVSFLKDQKDNRANSRELQDHAGITKGTLSKNLRDMVKNGYLQKHDTGINQPKEYELCVNN